MRRLSSCVVLAAGLATACTVGPDYGGPPRSPGAAAYARAADAAQPGPPLARWWTALNDQTLDALIARGLAANPDLAAAEARLRQARAAVRLERANGLPNVNGSAVYLHARTPGLAIGQNSGDQNGSGQTNQNGSGDGAQTLDFYNAGFDASWEVDLFGGRRRAVEEARAQAGAAEARLADAQVSLTAEIAQAYVNLRDVQRRMALADAAVTSRAQLLQLVEQRFAQGTASRLDLVQARNQLSSSRADATPLVAQRDAYLDALATLTGSVPGTLDASLAAGGALPLPPPRVAIGDPASLLRRRPDIRAAERTLAAQTAAIGQAVAAQFPKISFMGMVGLGGTSPSDLVSTDSVFALIAPRISWNFLSFGRNHARIAEARASRDEAEANYDAAVLAALRDAEDALARFGARRQTVAALARARGEAQAAVDLSAQRFAAGTATRIDLLEAEQRRIAADQALDQATAQLTGDFIALQKALGLGWGAA
ncbi:efflux transporter outer membrane subunit [Sphingomonas morindae]|uniref:Efflux transporter outer membrane subunit n=1 Tax=Sphingomonas morindae TaxID=1541170 RepID=A0ABY4XBT3_9SPHN|nr:efflux transporter outer membrane subunit [Sphingomonas morindae]USI74424.1 efflux transporter outer membrane subunit [Sphingomonas morindae]